jgi:hypothetical protein
MPPGRQHIQVVFGWYFGAILFVECVRPAGWLMRGGGVSAYAGGVSDIPRQQLAQ